MRNTARLIWAAPFLVLAASCVLVAAIALMVGLGPKQATKFMDQLL